MKKLVILLVCLLCAMPVVGCSTDNVDNSPIQDDVDLILKEDIPAKPSEIQVIGERFALEMDPTQGLYSMSVGFYPVEEGPFAVDRETLILKKDGEIYNGPETGRPWVYIDSFSNVTLSNVQEVEYCMTSENCETFLRRIFDIYNWDQSHIDMFMKDCAEQLASHEYVVWSVNVDLGFH